MSSRPRSATHFVANVVALGGGLGVLAALAAWRDVPLVSSLTYAPLVPCAVTFALLVAVEWVLRRSGGLADTELRW